MKRNGNDSNKQDSTSQYCHVTIAVLYLKLKEEKTVPKHLNMQVQKMKVFFFLNCHIHSKAYPSPSASKD